MVRKGKRLYRKVSNIVRNKARNRSEKNMITRYSMTNGQTLVMGLKNGLSYGVNGTDDTKHYLCLGCEKPLLSSAKEHRKNIYKCDYSTDWSMLNTQVKGKLPITVFFPWMYSCNWSVNRPNQSLSPQVKMYGWIKRWSKDLRYIQMQLLLRVMGKGSGVITTSVRIFYEVINTRKTMKVCAVVWFMFRVRRMWQHLNNAYSFKPNNRNAL